MTPATKSEEIIWAGFEKIKERISNRIKRSIRLPNSSLVLNWGEYGSGKTHSARYFSKESILNELKGVNTRPYPIVISLPKGKEPVKSLFISIIDKLNIEELRDKINLEDITLFIDNYGDNIHIQSVLKAIFNKDVDIPLLKMYLYGNISNPDLKQLNQYNILRKFNSDNDYTLFLSGLFSSITNEKTFYSLVTLWIDEFEDIAVLNSSNIDKTNNFLRELLDNTPNNLLLFINLTQSALIGAEDLGEFLYESVKSRIKERNNFELPDETDFRTYLKEIINYYKISSNENEYHPFSKEVVDELISLTQGFTLRRFNEAFSILLELADIEDASTPITHDFLMQNLGDIIWEV
ncbi:hypothetical protein D6T69_09860 [Tenacibaculum singaporense]|uniref:Uncharacterized protein n=2 Tax=Tenacibaculum singaporense TaxID=2358479 RepID=A0A3S8R7P6_9FLAO|nr:hypothetical protein [Tenacibaculum singaporense]AZJ35805.1 hypothetical protein D6T69_09860 [Tenacibaculum singaporense]